MNAAYITTVGKIREAINKNEFSTISDKILEGCKLFLLTNPSDSEIQSWKNSIPPFINALSKACDSLPVIVELKMPIGNERADLVLLGGEDSAIVVELKHWGTSKISKYKDIENQVVLGELRRGAMRTHPGYQADGYVGKIQNFHSIGNKYKIKGLSFLDSTPFNKVTDTILNSQFESPVYFSDQTEEMSNFISDFLVPNEMTLDSANNFVKGEYEISGRLVDFISNNKQNIKDKIYNILTTTGFSLSEEQLNAVNIVIFYAQLANEINSSGKRPTPRVFLINGDPGSGKTLVALSILIEAIGRGINAM